MHISLRGLQQVQGHSNTFPYDAIRPAQQDAIDFAIKSCESFNTSMKNLGLILIN